MVVNQNSFFPKRSFFANKRFTFAKLSRTPCLYFAGPILANNTSYENSFITCQITPENYGSLLGSLLNMQLASPSQDRFFLQNLLAHPLQHVLWLLPALSHNFRGTFPKIYLFTDPGHQQGAGGCTEGKAKTRGLGLWLLQNLIFGNLDTDIRILWYPFPSGPRAAMGGNPLHIMIIIPNFREIKFYFREPEKNSNIKYTTFAIKTPYEDL